VDPAQVTVGIETDRGLLVEALVAAGYRVYADTVVVAPAACNQRLVDACYLWAFAALSA
jgi:hypothetical protein